jgi:hypothetical protein
MLTHLVKWPVKPAADIPHKVSSTHFYVTDKKYGFFNISESNFFRHNGGKLLYIHHSGGWRNLKQMVTGLKR